MTLNTTSDKKDESKKLDNNKSIQEEKTSTGKEAEINKADVTNVQKMRNLVAKKKRVLKSKSPSSRNIVMMQPSTSFLVNHSIPVAYPPAVPIAYGPAVPVVTSIAPYFHMDIAGYNYPPSNWNSIVTIPNPVYPIAVPTMHVIAPQILTTPVCPFTTIISTPIMTEPVFPQAPSMDGSFETVSNPSSSYVTPNIPASFTQQDPSDYLTLPKDLFPTARTLAVDPNPIIDRFCRESGILGHSPWILDIEFGLPKMPVTRQIATYNSYYNSIHCKNTPGAIHPGFESCSADFKDVILFYYDCVISGWYRGFMMMNYDKSVENFQSWLQIPMQAFGMCWP